MCLGVVPVDPLLTLLTLSQLVHLVTADMNVTRVFVDLHDLTEQQPHQVEASLSAGTDGLRVRQLLSQVFEALQLENPLHVTEGLHQRDDGEVVLSGRLQQPGDVLDGEGVLG